MGRRRSLLSSINRLLDKQDTCFEENASLSSVRCNEEMDIKKYMSDLLQSLKKDINTNTDDKIKTVLESVNCLSAELKNLQCSVTELQNSHQKMEDRCDDLERTNRKLKEEIRDLHLQLQDIEQHSRSANIEIIGIPGRWLTAARRMRNLNASGIDPALNNSPVFINEHLTAHNKVILGRARRLQREKKISFAGFFNGKILVKVAEGAETERVTALTDLDKFDK
ncbi:hypothetical protein J6590_092833 [Homalodisca vitripennis]|nr:hypothetical protein J6590_092833 [Homalodisca vitripennis]